MWNVSVGVVVAASSSSAAESLYSIRSYLVAAVELLDIVVHAHAPASTNARARAIHLFTLNYLQCRDWVDKYYVYAMVMLSQ